MIPAGILIVPYQPKHRGPFRDLNLAWISRSFVVEEADRRVLDDPEGHILAGGGHILVALRDEAPVGVCALLPEPEGRFELAKMAVAESARGLGIGYALGRAAIELAWSIGACAVELVSNRSLTPALSLYRKLGFVEVPLAASEYQRADIRMVLERARPA
ncbi:MAG: GNAT family N-acetyltransferase [Gemmatimonadales bacterium]